jgi:catechol 2,3-dioxygenase-like lactoylglutathione lyase family enzyme
VQIHRLGLASRDPAGQARFWRDTLGLRVDEDPEGGVAVHLRRSVISFARAEPGREPRYHFAINIPRFRAQDAVAWLRARVDALPFDDGELVVRFDFIAADAVYFLDPDGNVVELIARDALPNDDASPFGPASLLEVSEIGIAATDVPATRDAVLAALGAPVFWGGLDDEGLTAIGDGAGAVLISPVGRGWIPTGLPALPQPTTIVAAGPRDVSARIPGGPYVIETIALRSS